MFIMFKSEKLFIINNLNNGKLLNKRSEFVSKCRHQNKFSLNSVKDDSKDWYVFVDEVFIFWIVVI